MASVKIQYSSVLNRYRNDGAKPRKTRTELDISAPYESLGPTDPEERTETSRYKHSAPLEPGENRKILQTLGSAGGWPRELPSDGTRLMAPTRTRLLLPNRTAAQ